MITYVNTVLVSNDGANNFMNAFPEGNDKNVPSESVGNFIVMTLDEKAVDGDKNYPFVTAETADKYERIKVGVVTDKNAVKVAADGTVTYEPIIKWSNVISADSVKSYKETKFAETTEDKITIDFSSLNAGLVSKFAEGGKRIIVRLTFKDTPTRYRKWTESYEYVTEVGDDATKIAKNIGTMINKEWKRARVYADTTTAKKIVLTAMKYDDDNSVDTLNWANKVRFNANVYYTDPTATGWESTNKHFPTGVTIDKEPGKTYVADAKLVRDREAQAMGYLGVLNRGEGTWPIVKPGMVTDLTKEYEAITLEFERMYRSADDLQRKTKETVEIYGTRSNMGAIGATLAAFVGTTSAFASTSDSSSEGE